MKMMIDDDDSYQQMRRGGDKDSDITEVKDGRGGVRVLYL